MLKIGHRGACGHAPENTLASFRKALELGVDMVELDVYVCASGELVVIHDDLVDRTTNGSGFVEQMSFQELRALDAGQGEKIPTLQEVLDVVNRKARVNIELKGIGTAKVVAQTIERYVVEHGWDYVDFCVSSFNHHELRRFKEFCPSVDIGALMIALPLNYAQFAQELGAASVNPSKEFVDQAFVDDAHQRGMQVFVFTLNDPREIERMRRLGVDGAFSNYPERI